jgi:hypothetical protein
MIGRDVCQKQSLKKLGERNPDGNDVRPMVFGEAWFTAGENRYLPIQVLDALVNATVVMRVEKSIRPNLFMRS